MEENLLHCAATLGMAAVELRGAIPFGLAFGLPADLVFLLAVVGNMLPMPFLLFSCERSFACSVSGPGGGRRSTAWNPAPISRGAWSESIGSWG